MAIKKLLIACHQISPVQEEGCFGVNMMHHATLQASKFPHKNYF